MFFPGKGLSPKRERATKTLNKSHAMPGREDRHSAIVVMQGHPATGLPPDDAECVRTGKTGLALRKQLSNLRP